jgi:hypothetical protein
LASAPRPCFDSVLFILDGTPIPIPEDCRYVYNDDGHTHHLKDPKGTLIPVAPEDPALSRGQRYSGIDHTEKTMDPGTKWEYILTEFDFHADPVVYEPMWADQTTCQAFGITLLQPGQCLPFSEPGMVKSLYTYGVFAGYQSPYLGSDRSRELLSVNATDLEYHAFAHIFSSQDTVPLVISVARWRPAQREIHLADLWVREGDCLYIPPKHYSETYVDMHGNRNSAFACWGLTDKSSLLTETTLGDDEVFAAQATKPHYHEEKRQTVHSRPTGA